MAGSEGDQVPAKPAPGTPARAEATPEEAAPRPDPVRPADDDARAIARGLIAQAPHAALAFVHPETGAPHVGRIALGPWWNGALLVLLSDLALHSRGLRRDARAALLVGEPGSRGDPLGHPRLSLAVRAEFTAPGATGRAAIREAYLERLPKARLYVDFGDFRFVRLVPLAGDLNAGFGRAYRLDRGDLAPPAADASGHAGGAKAPG